MKREIQAVHIQTNDATGNWRLALEFPGGEAMCVGGPSVGVFIDALGGTVTEWPGQVIEMSVRVAEVEHSGLDHSYEETNSESF